MKIFPAVHYSMGGLYTVYEAQEHEKVAGDQGQTIVGMKHGAPKNMMTNIPGLYAFGEVNYQYHGATRLGANALLNCIFDGIYCGPSVVNYIEELDTAAVDLPDAMYSRLIDQEQAKVKALLESQGGENPYELHREMGQWMTDYCTVIRNEQDMLKLRDQLATWKHRYKNVSLADTGMWTNQNLSFTRALGDMIKYAEAIVVPAIDRKESRGSHYRPDYPDRNDQKFLKTTLAKYDAANDTVVLEYEDVPQPMVKPRVRSYGKVEANDEKGDENNQTSAGSEEKAGAVVSGDPSVHRADDQQQTDQRDATPRTRPD
jgi:succinate dehydrogenase / fumarate reductase flavoprotein subunit